MTGALRPDEDLDTQARNGSDSPVVLTLGEAARMLRISPEHARKLALRQQLPGAFRLGRRHLVSVEPLRRYLATVSDVEVCSDESVQKSAPPRALRAS